MKLEEIVKKALEPVDWSNTDWINEEDYLQDMEATTSDWLQ